MAAAKPGASSSPASPDLDQLTLDQLRSLKEQADLEVNLLQDSLNNINTATARLDLASTALHDLSLRPQGKQLLVPLTGSLYVKGVLDDNDQVLVDVGTGYFVEKTMVEGKDYCQRKINLLKSNYEQLYEVAVKKKTIADEAGVILQAKLKQLSPSSGAGAVLHQGHQKRKDKDIMALLVATVAAAEHQNGNGSCRYWSGGWPNAVVA
ncbi:Prefoldin subunit 5-like protein [Drosera capensis]